MSHPPSSAASCPIRQRLALRRPRRPFWQPPAAGLDHWLEIQRDPLAWLADMHRRSPDLAALRMGPKRLWCVFHPDAVHDLMVNHRADLRRWEPSLCIMRQWNGRSFMMQEGEAARRQRQTVRPHIRPPAASEIRRLAGRHAAQFTAGQALDLDLEMAAYSVTLAGHALFDLDLGPNARTIAKAVRILSRVALLETSTGLPLGHWFPGRLCPRKRWALHVMRAQIEQVARDSRHPLAVHRDDLATLLMAAHQATGATLTWAQLLLAQHPEVLAALRAELATLDWAEITQLQDLRRAPLLRAVIQETLRLYPPAYALVPRQLARAMTVADTPLARGDIVMISSWITHRDARWFPEPEAFRPERFLSAPSWPQGAYFPFGLGDRACPGTGMAMMDLAASLAYSVEHWELTVLEPVVPQGWFSLRPKQARACRTAPAGSARPASTRIDRRHGGRDEAGSARLPAVMRATRPAGPGCRAARRYLTTRLATTTPITRKMMQSTRNRPNRNLAIAAEPAAMPVNPNSPATMAITAKIKAHLSMAIGSRELSGSGCLTCRSSTPCTANRIGGPFTMQLPRQFS